MTPLPKTFRSKTRLVVTINCIVVAPIVAVWGATLGTIVALVCGLVPLVYGGLVAWRMGVEATSDGLVLRGAIRARRIPWNDVDHVELLETWPYNAWVVTPSGSRIKTLGLGASGFRHRKSIEASRRMVRELNAIRSEVLVIARGNHDVRTTVDRPSTVLLEDTQADEPARRSSPISRGARMAGFPAIAHVALTVNDLDRSVPWYRALFGAEPVMDEDTGLFRQVVWLIGGQTLIGLHQFARPSSRASFTELRPGLDHVAFACADRAELEHWVAKLDELGVENGGIVDASYGSGLSFRDPDNIALEFFAPPG